MSNVDTTDRVQPNITFTIIKSDAVKNGVASGIINMITDAGFFVIHGPGPDGTVIEMSMAKTVKFYYEHIGRPYFPDLIKSLADGCIPMILEYPQTDESAVTKLRALIGATSSRMAEPHTIRGRFGGHIFNPDAPVAENAIHGSDSLINVINEIKTVFPEVTSIKSILYGEFELDSFQVGAPVIPDKIKILQVDYDAFLEKFNNGDFGIKFGKAFYNQFKLYESIFKDDSRVKELYDKDKDEAFAIIANFVKFI